MNIQLENIENQLKAELLELDAQSPVERYNASVILINQAVAKLKEFLKNTSFTSRDDEIFFFKQIRPKILSYKIGVSLRYNLSVNEPIGTTDIVIHYFEDVLKGFQTLFKLNSFYYQYYRNQFTELDHLYFIREADHSQIPLPELTDPEHQDSTPMSDLYAKFIAYEQTHYDIIKRVTSLTNRQDIVIPNETDLDLKWTGEVVNIVELAYGLWLTGQLNNGNASLNQIVRWLELNLDVNIGIAQRKFTEISRRKRISVTKFVDQMQEAIINKVEADNK
jgi:hypothetical protein